jgi:23S rRNA pseudouridine955/2504/2580 synthase
LSHGENRSSGVRFLHVEAGFEGQRIDNFLFTHLKGVPRSLIYRVLRRGEVRVNKGRVKPGYRLQEGDRLRIPPMRVGDPPIGGRASADLLRVLEASILFEDERLMVVDKPAGLAAHGGSGLSYGLIEAMRQLRPHLDLDLVHRLDRETSGCIVLAKRRGSLRELHRLMRENAVDKRYLALLAGRLPRREIRVEAPLQKNTLRSGERIVRVDPDRGKAANTVFRRLRQLRGLTLVEAQLTTGRTHQIRVHAAFLGSPLAGDGKYGNEDTNRRLRHEGLKRLFLHAASLTFQPGYRDRPLHVEAPLPADLNAVLHRLGAPQ